MHATAAAACDTALISNHDESKLEEVLGVYEKVSENTVVPCWPADASDLKLSLSGDRAVICSWDCCRSEYDEAKLREILGSFGSIEEVSVASPSEVSQKATGVVVFKQTASANTAVSTWGDDYELKLSLSHEKSKKGDGLEQDASVETAGSGEGGLTSEEDLQTANKTTGGGTVVEEQAESGSETFRGVRSKTEIVEVKAESSKRSKRESRDKKREKKKRKKDKSERSGRSKESKEDHSTRECKDERTRKSELVEPETHKRHRKDERDKRKDDDRQKKKERHKEIKQKEDRHRHRHHRDDEDYENESYYRDDEDDRRHRRFKDENYQYRDEEYRCSSRERHKDSDSRRRERSKDSHRAQDEEKERRASSKKPVKEGESHDDHGSRKKRHRGRNDPELKEISRSNDENRERHKDERTSNRDDDHHRSRRRSKDYRDEERKKERLSDEENRRGHSSRSSALRDEKFDKSNGAAYRKSEAGVRDSWDWNMNRGNAFPPFGHHYGTGLHFPVYGGAQMALRYPPNGYLGHPHSSWYGVHSSAVEEDPEKLGWNESWAREEFIAPELKPSSPSPESEPEELQVKKGEASLNCSGRSSIRSRNSGELQKLLSKLSVSAELAGTETYGQYLQFMADEQIEVPDVEASAAVIATTSDNDDDDLILEADPEAQALLHRGNVAGILFPPLPPTVFENALKLCRKPIIPTNKTRGTELEADLIE